MNKGLYRVLGTSSLAKIDGPVGTKIKRAIQIGSTPQECYRTRPMSKPAPPRRWRFSLISWIAMCLTLSAFVGVQFWPSIEVQGLPEPSGKPGKYKPDFWIYTGKFGWPLPILRQSVWYEVNDDGSVDLDRRYPKKLRPFQETLVQQALDIAFNGLVGLTLAISAGWLTERYARKRS